MTGESQKRNHDVVRNQRIPRQQTDIYTQCSVYRLLDGDKVEAAVRVR
jgi:hypothetical protein